MQWRGTQGAVARVTFVALAAAALAACAAEVETGAPGPEGALGEAPAPASELTSVYEREGERLEVTAALPIGGDTVMHYRYTSDAGEDATWDATPLTEGIEAFFGAVSPELREQLDREIAASLDAARTTDELSFLQLQQGIAEASVDGKALYCSNYSTPAGCLSPGWGYVDWYRCKSSWWVFCSCSYWFTGITNYAGWCG